jgi:nucleoside-diphosphate-sugar epimerase
VIRPGIVYGKRGGLVGGLMLGTPGAVKVVGDGENHWPLIHVKDLADLYVRAATRPSAHGRIYNGTDGSRVRVRWIAEAFARASGRTVSLWPLEEARGALGPVADALAMDQQVSSARAMLELDWRPRHRDIVAEAGAILRAATAKPVAS